MCQWAAGHSVALVRKHTHAASVGSKGNLDVGREPPMHTVTGTLEVGWSPLIADNSTTILLQQQFMSMPELKPGLSDLLASFDMLVGSPNDNFRQSHIVTYMVQDGTGARLQAMITAMLVAAVTGRSLWVGPFTSGHDSENICTYSNLLTIRDFPVVTDETFKCVNCSSTDLPFTSGDCGVDLVVIAQTMESVRDETLRFPWFWNWYTGMFGPHNILTIAKFVDQHLDFSDIVQHTSAQIIATLPKRFAAMHFRLGDRFGGPLADCTKYGMTMGLKGPINATYEMEMEGVSFGRHNMDYLSNFFSCPTLMDNGKVEGLSMGRVFNDWQLPEGLNHIYLATNEPTDPRVLNVIAKGKAKNLTFILWEDIDSELRARALAQPGFQCSGPRTGSFLSEIEQAISIHAELYLPSWPSSWDEFVITKRLAQGKPDAPSQAELVYASVTHIIQMRRYSSDNQCPPAPADHWLGRESR